MSTAHNVVGEFAVDRDVVELLGTDRLFLGPVLAAIPGFTDSAVIAVKDMVGVERIDPYTTRIDVAFIPARPGWGFEGLAAIFGYCNPYFHGVELVFIVGIYFNPSRVARLNPVDHTAAAHDLVLGHPLPGFSLIVRPVYHTVLLNRLHLCENTAVEKLKDVTVDHLVAAGSILIFLFLFTGLGHIQHLLNFIHHCQDILVIFVDPSCCSVERNEVDFDFGLKLFILDQLVQFFGQFILVFSFDGFELDLFCQGRIDFERLEFIEIKAVFEHAACPEVAPVFTHIKSQIDLLVHPDVDDICVFGIHGQSVPSRFDIHGKAFGKFFPGFAAVRGFVEMITRLFVDKSPASPIGLVSRCDDDIGIFWIDDKIADSPVFEIKHPFPGFAAVCGFVETALIFVEIVVVEFTLCSHIDDIGILVIDGYPGNVVTLLQSDMRPGLSSICRFPHAVTVSRRAGMHSFTCSDINDIRVGRRYLDIAHAHVAVFVENRHEGNSSVLGLPEAA